MPGTRRKPALRKATDYVLSLIETNRYVAGDYLPPGLRLADQADVSPVTMWKALRALAHTGHITLSKGKPARVEFAPPYSNEFPAAGTSSPEPDRPRTIRGRLKHTISHDILLGRYQPGSFLPSLKEMQNAYATSYHTLKEALKELVAEGLISTTGTRFTVPGPFSFHGNACIVLLGIADQYGKVNLGILGDELLRRIEEECATARVSLRIVPHGIIETQVQDWSEYAEIFPSLHRRSKEGGKVVLGYLSALPGSGESAKRIIRFLSQLNEPVSILEQIGGPPSRSFPPTRSTMRVFSLARNVEASTAVAGFLLARGHRKVAFISGHHGMQWSRIRFDTIRDRYRNAGLNNGVACFAADRQVLDIRRNALRNRALEKIMRPSTAILKQIGLENSRFFEVSLEGSLRRFLGNSTLYRTLLPLFEEACRHEDVSAWVCVNDVTALLALEYLRTRRIAVPEKLSVIGFDNSPEALASNLTSYSFNPDHLAHAMVHHILFPGSSSSLRAVPRLTEVKGRIVERGTVGHRPTRRG